MMRILLSACLLGLSTPYHGNPGKPWREGWNTLIESALSLGIELLPVCPEQLGGLPTPRPPSELQTSASEILSGRGVVLNSQGVDVTRAFVEGAHQTLLIAQRLRATGAIFKSRSPSCGFGNIYSGRFDSVLIDGHGITSALLLENGIDLWESGDFFTLWQQFPNFSFLYKR